MNTERLTLKPVWMKYTILQSAIYSTSGRKAWWVLQYFARRGCTKHVQLTQGDT